MREEEAIKLFGLNNLTIESDIRQIEREFDVDLGHRDDLKQSLDQIYYPQFSERLRAEASSMSTNYAIFYCLENSIRELIVQRLEEQHGSVWWDTAVPESFARTLKETEKRTCIGSHSPLNGPY